MHGFLTFLFLINGYWLPLILNLPLLVWNIKKIVDNTHLLDATEIFRKLNVHKKVQILSTLVLHLGELELIHDYRNPSSNWVSTWSCSSSTCTA